MPKFYKLFALITIIIANLMLVPPAFAGSYSNGTGVIVDGTVVTQTVSVSNETTVAMVAISINFHKADDPCPNGGTGWTFNDEIGFQLISPLGTTVSLVNPGDYTDIITDGGTVMVTFSDNATSSVSSVPATGTFLPASPLSIFNGEGANGLWTLRIEDTVVDDPLCLFSWTLYINSGVSQNSECVDCPVFYDGRINNYDTGTPVVLYGKADADDNWRLEVYNADGTGLLVVVYPEMIAAVPECPDENTLIYNDETTGISLWRLPVRMVTEDGVNVCPFQLNAPSTEAGKTYIIIFDALYPNSYYQSHEEWIGQ
jgi:hypothetical protein